jgi:cyclin A
MEHLILKVLAFRVAAPTSNLFCMDLLHSLSASESMSALSNYLLELTLLDGDVFIKYLPSVVATSSVYLANYVLTKSSCMSGITEHTGYQMSDLKDCTRDMFTALHRASSHPQQAVRNKYDQAQTFFVSQTTLPATLPVEAL